MQRNRLCPPAPPWTFSESWMNSGTGKEKYEKKLIKISYLVNIQGTFYRRPSASIRILYGCRWSGVIWNGSETDQNGIDQKNEEKETPPGEVGRGIPYFLAGTKSHNRAITTRMPVPTPNAPALPIWSRMARPTKPPRKRENTARTLWSRVIWNLGRNNFGSERSSHHTVVNTTVLFITHRTKEMMSETTGDDKGKKKMGD